MILIMHNDSSKRQKSDHQIHVGQPLTFSVQVDDGSEGRFGTEIELRGLFEACACDLKQEFSMARQKDAQNGEIVLGWEGVQLNVAQDESSQPGDTAATESAESPQATDLQEGSDQDQENSLAICLCVEGGPGTIGTVQVLPLSFLLSRPQ
jgi:hypothetical protein